MAADSSDPNKCCACGAIVAPGRGYFCDRVPEGPWCGSCFDKTDCGKGLHDEGCETVMFSDAPHGSAI